MLIICDFRTPKTAIAELSKRGKVELFKSEILANSPLQGHPDLFMCQTPSRLILAPNIPKDVLNSILEQKIPFVFGELPTDISHPGIARYNAIVTQKVTICNPKSVDEKILELSGNNQQIEVKQSYNRCSTVAITDDKFLTSDVKTHTQLEKKGFESILIDPKSIKLEGYSHGLFGGCVGVCKPSKTVYITGSLSSIENRRDVVTLVEIAGYTIMEFSNFSLLDVGGIFFI